MAQDAVLSFLEEHNRPFSIHDIIGGVKGKGEFGKAAVQKALDALVNKGKVKEKLYGKQKVYHIAQNVGPTGNQLRETLLEMDRRTNEISVELKEVNDKLKAKSNILTEKQGKVSIADLIEKKVDIEKQLEIVKEDLIQYADVDPISPKRKEEVEKLYAKALTEYKKRKRMCMDVVNAILENYPKSKKQLLEDMGIETDEDVGFSLDLK
ncbi:unnamed protein product [Acanthoscelides obtectus]|uniref:Homologous-pairing protein 2 homolog n=1 Tax=Acanthoscelides obtectus TaxID=200917 RepID=A0A9P0JPM2_ACAOB|nr:unnamed protein product [Acanthoscelides obtectus]CAK1671295.1 Homologous-pairing protein 2 homolog [Acanthoscelides obtectus]